MSRILTLGATLALSLAVAGALTFGSVQLLSADNHCPVGGGFAGTCQTQQECEVKCAEQYPGQNLIAICDQETGCCNCLL
jgi:hypothetical protein